MRPYSDSHRTTNAAFGSQGALVAACHRRVSDSDRCGGEHVQQSIRRWFGDSIGHWEEDTLVVDTTNVSEKVQYRGSTGRVHVVERLTRTGPSTITYRATVDDPDTWSTPWTREIPFTATSAPLFEYACHEHNYSMEG